MLSNDPNPNAEPHETRNTVRFNISNETRKTEEVTVRWSLRDSGSRILMQREEQLSVPALSAVWLDREDLSRADPREDHVFWELVRDGEVLSEGSVLFCPPKYYSFRDPALTCRVEGRDIIVRAAAYAADVEVRNGNEDLLLSDNYFDMEAGERRLRILRGKPEGIMLRSTWDIR